MFPTDVTAGCQAGWATGLMNQLMLNPTRLDVTEHSNLPKSWGFLSFSHSSMTALRIRIFVYLLALNARPGRYSCLDFIIVQMTQQHWTARKTMRGWDPHDLRGFMDCAESGHQGMSSAKWWSYWIGQVIIAGTWVGSHRRWCQMQH